MFTSNDLKDFGKRLRDVRQALGHSQALVSNCTGINMDTLRKIENGYALPRYDTLATLSEYYKMDLLHTLSIYKASSHLLRFYGSLDRLIARNAISELRGLFEDFKSKIPQDRVSIASDDELLQVDLFIQGLEMRYDTAAESKEGACAILCKALSISNPLFNVEEFEKTNYTYFEIRILIALAAALGDLRRCDLSNRISLFVLECLSPSIHNTRGEESLIIKCYSQMSYNYHRMDDSEKSLAYAEKGIEMCLTFNNMEILYYLYLRKGAAEYYLKKTEYKKSFSHMLSLLEIKKDNDTYDAYVQVIKENYTPPEES